MLIGYITLCALCWNPSINNQFHYAAIGLWILISCYLSNIGGSFQVSLFTVFIMILIAGFSYEVINIQREMSNSGIY